ncbi:hypothetical protein VT84_09275 [Gemmata sp. SH-PL17]|uniref:phage portal protein family protein n=1 Tax=Gemmata sp. SH-PL17 TaxID=1630693 RepID=UPI00078EC46B|nr:DUF935 family protein [Gemmata sp. SH-PL17]AMV24574.1 hypothetical protein VT84_09275 [Gemmata sp. SH-PL17]
MFGRLNNIANRLSGAPAAQSNGAGVTTLMPIPQNQAQWNGLFMGMFGAPGAADPTHDRMVSDVYNGPYRGPLDLDRDGCETAAQRQAYRKEYGVSPVFFAAVRGKADDIEALEPTVLASDKDDWEANAAAEFVKWTVSMAPGGWPGLIDSIYLPGSIDGFSVLEKRLKQQFWKGRSLWGLAHCRSLDTCHIRLQLDVYRNVVGVVNLVRGLEYYEPSGYILYTHNGMFNNPFGRSDGRAAVAASQSISTAYMLWKIALTVYGLPYMVGKTTSQKRALMEQALSALRGGGYAVLTDEKDAIEAIDLATGAALSGFKDFVDTRREDVFFATRGVAQPFVEGDGGQNAHGDTKVQQGTSNAGEKRIAHNIADVINRQLIPWLVGPNFDLDESRMPRVRFGGTDWQQISTVIDVVTKAQEAGVEVSAEWVHEATTLPAPRDENDRLVSPQERQQQAQMQAQQQQQQMLAQPGDPSQPASAPGGGSEADPTGTQDEVVAAALDALGVDGGDVGDTSAFSQDFASGRTPGTGPPPFPGAVFDRSRHRWVRGHRPDDDDAPAPQYPSRVNPGVLYGNQDDRDSDDRLFRGHQKKLDRANTEVERVRAQLAAVEKRDPAQDPKVKALQAKMDQLNARAAQLKTPQQQRARQQQPSEGAQAVAAALQKIPPEKKQQAVQRVATKAASSPESQAVLARADKWADAQAAKHADRVAAKLNVSPELARMILAQTIRALCREALEGGGTASRSLNTSMVPGGGRLNLSVKRKQFSDDDDGQSAATFSDDHIEVSAEQMDRVFGGLLEELLV